MKREKLEEILIRESLNNIFNLVEKFKKLQKENQEFKKEAKKIKDSFGKIRRINGTI